MLSVGGDGLKHAGAHEGGTEGQHERARNVETLAAMQRGWKWFLFHARVFPPPRGPGNLGSGRLGRGQEPAQGPVGMAR